MCLFICLCDVLMGQTLETVQVFLQHHFLKLILFEIFPIMSVTLHLNTRHHSKPTDGAGACEAALVSPSPRVEEVVCQSPSSLPC